MQIEQKLARNLDELLANEAAKTSDDAYKTRTGVRSPAA